jgi:hypothetical protein
LRITDADIYISGYARALSGIAEVFRVAPAGEERALVFPYWALPPTDVVNFLMGKTDDRANTAIMDKVFAAKLSLVENTDIPGVDPNSMTIDSPIPYSLRQLWFDLVDPEVKTCSDSAKVIEIGTRTFAASRTLERRTSFGTQSCNVPVATTSLGRLGHRHDRRAGQGARQPAPDIQPHLGFPGSYCAWQDASCVCRA